MKKDLIKCRKYGRNTSLCSAILKNITCDCKYCVYFNN